MHNIKKLKEKKTFMATRPFDIVSFLLFLAVFLVVMFILFVIVLSLKPKLIERILKKNGFYIYQINNSFKGVLIESVKLTFVSLSTHSGYRSKFFNKIQARSLKDKRLLIVQEKYEEMPYYRLVYVLKNPTLHFPSFKLTRNVFEPVSVPKEVEERDVTKYFQLVAQNRSLVLSKLQTYQLKKHYKKITKQTLEINVDQKTQTITIVTDRYKTAMTEVLPFILDLNIELENYRDPTVDLKEGKIVEQPKIEIVPNSFKIYNTINLENISNLNVKCLICWQKIDYSSETLLFECCSGYCHIDHGLDWLKTNEKCPKCGTIHPYTIQLPDITV